MPATWSVHPHPSLPPEHRPSKHMTTTDYHNPGKSKTFAFAFVKWVSNGGFVEWKKKTWNSSISQAFLDLSQLGEIDHQHTVSWLNETSHSMPSVTKSWLLPATGYTNMDIILPYKIIMWSWYIVILLLDKYEAIIWSHIEKRAENKASLHRNLGFWWLIVCKLGHG